MFNVKILFATAIVTLGTITSPALAHPGHDHGTQNTLDLKSILSGPDMVNVGESATFKFNPVAVLPDTLGVPHNGAGEVSFFTNPATPSSSEMVKISHAAAGLTPNTYINQIIEKTFSFNEPGDYTVAVSGEVGWHYTDAAGKHAVNGSVPVQITKAVTVNSASQPVPEPTVTLGILAFGALGANSLLKRKHKCC